MNRPQELVLIRHAESERNQIRKGSAYFADDEARRTLRGIPDHKISITAEGVEQARRTGLKLVERLGRPQYVYHSGYARTIETMHAVLEAFPEEERRLIKTRMNMFIREREPGHAYDMTTEEAEAAFPWLKEHWETAGGFFARPPGGESLSDVAERFYLFLNMLFRDRAGERVWVFLHGGTLRVARFLLERWDYERALSWPKGQSPENCGITRYVFDHDTQKLVLQEYNTVHWR